VRRPAPQDARQWNGRGGDILWQGWRGPEGASRSAGGLFGRRKPRRGGTAIPDIMGRPRGQETGRRRAELEIAATSEGRASGIIGVSEALGGPRLFGPIFILAGRRPGSRGGWPMAICGCVGRAEFKPFASAANMPVFFRGGGTGLFRSRGFSMEAAADFLNLAISSCRTPASSAFAEDRGAAQHRRDDASPSWGYIHGTTDRRRGAVSIWPAQPWRAIRHGGPAGRMVAAANALGEPPRLELTLARQRGARPKRGAGGSRPAGWSSPGNMP